MVATRRSNSTGLWSNSLHPAAIAFSRSPAMACADKPMIGMSRVCGVLLSRRVASAKLSALAALRSMTSSN
jgi:hypothetical protein